MNDAQGVYVTLAPRSSTARLFSAPDVHAALERIEARPDQSARRLAVWMDGPAPGQGPDVVVCIPVGFFKRRRTQAEQVVASWDAAWLLLESMPHQHREAARRQLVDEISMALLAAAIEGMDGPPIEDLDT
jgi:hypothetical protein